MVHVEHIAEKVKLKLKFRCWCDCSDAYILVNETITIDEAGADDNIKQLDDRKKWVISKNCAPSTNCINEINSTQ